MNQRNQANMNVGFFVSCPFKPVPAKNFPDLAIFAALRIKQIGECLLFHNIQLVGSHY